MSIKQIVITTPQQFNDSLSKIANGEIVAIVDPDTDINLKDLSLILEMFLNDGKIGFVFTDILINSNDVSFINYLNSKEIYSVSFFLRKPQEEIIVQEGDIKAQIMQQMISRGYTFEHIAEPVFCKKE